MRTFVLLALCAAGCVTNNGGMTRDQAKSAGDALGNGIEDSAKSFGPMSGGATVDGTCATASGNTADPDGDSIPTSATVTYDCTSMALGYTGKLTGTEMVVDDDPASIAWKFTVSADLHASLTGPGGATITRDWDGSIVAGQMTAVGPYTLVRALDAVTVFKTAMGDLGGAGKTTTVTEDNDWTVTYTPMIQWTPGSITVTGSVTATGTWNVDTDGVTAAATLATPTALTLTPSCATAITAGQIVGTYDNGAHSITVTWTACGQRAVTST